jgi:hypothetical protein
MELEIRLGVELVCTRIERCDLNLRTQNLAEFFEPVPLESLRSKIDDLPN